MEAIVKSIKIDRKTNQVIKEEFEKVKIDNDPWESFYDLMADEFIKFMEGKDNEKRKAL